ncbi:MAG: chorismate-binding protein [Pseudobdellovibrionaceae bacterium]|nr:chorismate-binding protein [Pseudobdellovibrionaceae bacterium]
MGFDKKFFERGAFLAHQGQLWWTYLEQPASTTQYLADCLAQGLAQCLGSRDDGDGSSREESYLLLEEFYFRILQSWSYPHPLISPSEDQRSYLFTGVVFQRTSIKELLSSSPFIMPLENQAKPKLWLLNGWKGPNKNHFSEQWDWAQAKLAQKDLQKAVLIEASVCHLEAPLSLEEKEYLFRQLILRSWAYPQAWAYGVWWDQQGAMGLTPELLFEQQNQNYVTMAVAGTRPLLPAVSDDLSSYRSSLVSPQGWGSKERKEHEIVVQDLVARVSSFGSCEVQPYCQVNYPGLQHLCAVVTFYPSQGVTLGQLLQCLHPTSAMGLFPNNTENYRSFSQLLAQKNRGWFGAPLVFQIEPSWAIAPVMIRGIFWNKDIIKIPAGVGVVLESNLESEWQELLWKIDSVRGIFSLNDSSTCKI